MTEEPTGAPGPIRDGKYARVERERRFLLAQAPRACDVLIARQISDRYLTGTRLRLRRIQHLDDGHVEYKLTQKVPADRPGPAQGLITTIYLTVDEYDLLAGLPAAVLTKTRLSVPPVGVDIFDGPLRGLIMAEAEFSSDAAAEAFTPPVYAVAEVTTDARFTGGHLARTTRCDLLPWLTEYHLTPNPRPQRRP